MNSLLINIVAFGAGGVLINAALQGLLLVLSGNGSGTGPRRVLGVAAFAVLALLPALAAFDLLRRAPDGGPWAALASALCVALLVYCSNLAFTALFLRRLPTARSAPAQPPVLGGLAACVLLGAAGAGLATLLA
ncbi:hypothetical protein [Nocardiopsis ansamitocini]|uniref:Uncharacterized protein n=1 Tax=Nocardiopsis ansamitocini TaxID=1670832 RepID=A0A9W6UFY8_9ACTN|nr:hypothetical protein [Nocardiopsis ansamitocini]GLU46171.1 hypothetical protein Nans01_05220 [Nocardiopsis ansamitocini]